MNNKSAKLMLFSLVMTLFSLMLVFAALAFAFVDFAYHASNNSYFDTGPTLIVWLAIIVGIGGLVVAYTAITGND